jgi:hypothetical protein
MKLLSIDCGVKNLAYCLYNTETKLIELWEVVDISIEKCTYIPEMCIAFLENNKRLMECDNVIIEKQPPRNPKMRIMEASLYSYFILCGKLNIEGTIKNVQTFSPVHKLAGILGISGKKSYGARKKIAINKVKDLLGKETSDVWLRYFCEHKKRDDLADAYLMILAYIEHQDTANSAPPKRILAKKPKENTKVIDYTPSNIKFILREHITTLDNFLNENTDLSNLINVKYGSIEECLKQVKL